MPDVYETEDEQRPDIQRYLEIARRRFLPFLIALFAGWLAIWGFSWTIHPTYKSSTTILVDRPTLTRLDGVPSMGLDLQARLESIQEQILSRTRLLTIIDKLHLYAGPGRPMSADDKVTAMRKQIDIEVAKDIQGSTSSFTVSYSSGDPRVAQLVTQELTNLFINENLETRQRDSEDTTKFLEGQLQSASESLSAQDQKVRAFEMAHAGALPAQQANNMQILGGLQAQLQSEEDALNNANQQRTYLQTLMSQYASPALQPRSGNGTLSQVESLDQQLQKLRTQLADLKSRYTDSYPDVQSVKFQITELEKQRQQAIAAERSAKPGAEGGAASMTLAQLQGQMDENKVDIENREKSIASLQGQIAMYRTRLDTAPASQQQLEDLTRVEDQLQTNYNNLLKQKQASEMTSSMQQLQVAEPFTMLDPPSLPTKPDAPNRVKLSAIGFAVGVLLGIAVVVILEVRDDRLYSDAEIKELLPAAVIVEIPEISNPAEERSRKRKVLVGWVTAVSVFALILVGSMVSYLHG